MASHGRIHIKSGSNPLPEIVCETGIGALEQYRSVLADASAFCLTLPSGLVTVRHDLISVRLDSLPLQLYHQFVKL
jgi:hypothetical protein